MRAIPFVLLLAGCAAQPLAPLPDSAGPIGMQACHPISEAAYEAAPGSAATNAAAVRGGFAINYKGGIAACRTLDDGSHACDVRGEAYVRAAEGAQVRHFHVPATRIGTINSLGGTLTCRMLPG